MEVKPQVHESDPLPLRLPTRWAPDCSVHTPAGPHNCQWAVVVGDRVRRLRMETGQVLTVFSRRIAKPFQEGRHYSASYLSRLERGWAAPPLFVYIALANTFGVPPGRLLGPDEVQLDVTEAEMMLLRVMRSAGIAPHDAVVRLVGAHAAHG